MSRTETEATLTNYYAAMKSGDREAMRAVVADNITVTYHDSTNILPWGGIWEGFDGFQDFLSVVADHLVIESVVPRDTFIDGNTVIVVLDGKWLVKATGKRAKAVVANIFTMAEGRVARYQVFPDSAAFGLALEHIQQG